ncbi:MAG TPA: carboxypeptidase regulatory-like domain-containing protein [Terriglobales bacterium]|nr:carboxypeptidase regulatory-like domain-containing protein [Terriglobales bacterium]
MRRPRLCVFLRLITILMLGVVPSLAQFQAGLQGTVRDNTGAVVSGASITATEDATRVPHTATSNASGFYRISQLPPGTYTVSIDAKGFKTSTLAGVVVEAETVRGFDVTMQLGGGRETVNVTAAPAALQTEDATISGTLTTPEVQNLPEIDRDPYELIRLAPGVFGDGARFGDGRSAGFPNGSGAVSGSAGPGGSNTAIFQIENQQPISAMGQRVTSNDYLVDGVSANSLAWGGAAVITPSIESVQEITVLSNDYDASDGRSSGAHIKTVTKSGTNAFHGGGLFLYHDPNFNAFNKFGGFAGSSFAPPLRDDDALRQFAGTLGGPIIKNKLFFFFNYEGARANNTTFQPQYVETPQYDAALLALRPGTPVATILGQSGLTPRISQLLPPSCTGFSAGTCNIVGTGMDIGSPVGPYNMYDSTSTFSNGIGGGFDGVPDLEIAEIFLPASTKGDQYNARLDYNSDKNFFSINVFLTYLNTLAADASAQGRPNADFGTKNFSPSGFLSWIRVINPTTVNEARFNFTRYGYNGITANPQVNWAIPRIEIQGFPQGERVRYGAQQGDNTPAITGENTFAFRDMLSKVIGNKAFKFGFEFSREQDNDALIGGARPDQVFQGPWNFANGTPIFEQIEVNPITGSAPISRPQYFRSSTYGVFVQNDWKLRPNLTINLGLRWEYYAPPTEAKGNLTNFVPTSDPVNGLQDGSEINPRQQWKSTWLHFGPRLGFAWSPERYNSKLVFRGGFGIAYDRFDDNVFNNTRNNPPDVASYGICCGTSSNPFVSGQILFNTGTSNNPLSYPGNSVLATGLGSNGLPIFVQGGPYVPPNIYANPVNMPVPYVYLYSTQMQYSFPGDWVFTVGYQGSAGHHLTRITNLSYFYPIPNKSLNQIFNFVPDTNTDFNALTTQFEHRFHHGLSANVQYTYSKSIDQLSAEGPGFVTNQTYPIDDHTERGPSDYDATHNFRAYAVWDLPILRTRTDFWGKVVGGWELNGIYQFHSGFPWTPVSDNVCPVIGFNTICPIRPTRYNGGAGQNYDTSAFLPPTSGNFPAVTSGLNPYFDLETTCGNPCLPEPPGIGRNSFRGPRYQDIDISVLKEFGLPRMRFVGEGAKIQLRMTAYNVFNKLNLAPFSFGSTSTTVSSSNSSPGVPLINPQFGTATSGLEGRVLELQARFSF